MPMKWYGVHTYSSFENKVRLNLLESIKNEGMEEFFEEILIPCETVVELKKGDYKKTVNFLKRAKSKRDMLAYGKESF